MCTPSQKLPFGSRSIVIASSKSRACSPSIVTVGTRRKSVRPRMSFSETVVPSRTASATASAACASGIAPLADDDLGVDAGCVDVAEHVGDAADRAARGGRPARQLDDHHLSRRRAAFLARRDDDVHQHAAIEWRDVAHAAVVAVVAADQRAVAALEHPDDAPFGAAAVLDALDADHDAVAVHRLVEMRVGNVDVAAAGFERPLRRHEPVARRVRLQAADVEVHLLGQTETIASNLNEVARGDERFDVPLERRAVVLRHFEYLQQLAHAGGMMHPLAHEREHLIA